MGFFQSSRDSRTSVFIVSSIFFFFLLCFPPSNFLHFFIVFFVNVCVCIRLHVIPYSRKVTSAYLSWERGNRETTRQVLRRVNVGMYLFGCAKATIHSKVQIKIYREMVKSSQTIKYTVSRNEGRKIFSTRFTSISRDEGRTVCLSTIKRILARSLHRVSTKSDRSLRRSCGSEERLEPRENGTRKIEGKGKLQARHQAYRKDDFAFLLSAQS